MPGNRIGNLGPFGNWKMFIPHNIFAKPIFTFAAHIDAMCFCFCVSSINGRRNFFANEAKRIMNGKKVSVSGIYGIAIELIKIVDKTQCLSTMIY